MHVVNKKHIAYVLVGLFGAYSLLELLLAMGLPYGKFAWGGTHETLSTTLRIASAASIGIYITMAVIILSYVRVIAVITHYRFLRIALWVLFGYFCLGAIMNAASRSPSERIHAPISLFMALLVYLLVKHKD